MKVKQYRLAWKMSQRDLSQLTGLSIRHIRDIESGMVSPTHIRADTAIRLAHTFGVSVEDLLECVWETDTGKLLYASEFQWLTQSQSSPKDTQ